ncbi:MAG: nickel pincer cofactor biosynthesis protein LarC, partial [Anaerolineae bacterium]
MSRIAYFDCFSGASGDMLLGSLLDAGLGLEQLEADLAHLEVTGYSLGARRVTRHGLTGTQFEVQLAEDERPARTMPAIERIIGSSDLVPRIKERSLAVFRRIAQAEAAIHGTTPDQVHFHEIGAVDSLVDIVGFICGLERLRIETVYSSPLAIGGGTVMTEHGRLPVPAPATLALLAQANAPTMPKAVQTEILTPTGAALLTEVATFRRPEMAIENVGYGFGSKELTTEEGSEPGVPNALRVWIGAPLAQGTLAPGKTASRDAPPAAASAGGDEVALLACNLDDVSGEVLGYCMERLFADGALDVWFTPIQMKKNRPATQISVLARPKDADRLAMLLLRETPTLGVRRQILTRTKADREIRKVATPWGPVRVKVKAVAGQTAAASPEYEDCARLASEAGVPLSEVMEAARSAAQMT